MGSRSFQRKNKKMKHAECAWQKIDQFSLNIGAILETQKVSRITGKENKNILVHLSLYNVKTQKQNKTSETKLRQSG